jgi:hypothetical protein
MTAGGVFEVSARALHGWDAQPSFSAKETRDTPLFAACHAPLTQPPKIEH